MFRTSSTIALVTALFALGCTSAPPPATDDDAGFPFDAAADASGGPDLPAPDSGVFDVFEFDLPALSDQPLPVDVQAPDVPADAAAPDAPADRPADADPGPPCAPGTSRCGDRCADLAADPAHCGACGMNCHALPGVAPTGARCESGQCVLDGACATGRGDCDRELANGCEADLSSPATCGRCITTCIAAAPLCAPVPGDGGTGYACSSGCTPTAHSRCGGSCVDTAADLRHCGGCGRACAAPAGGAATCAAGRCERSCPSGAHLCGDRCAADGDVATCGGRCDPCPAGPANSRATCSAGACGFACDAGFHRCGTLCLPDASVASCGAACTACPSVPNGAATCDGTSCGFTCGASYHRCGGACASNGSVASCGSSCAACPVPARGRATCDGTSCGLACDAGAHLCGAACSANADPASCGARCSPCPSVANGRATCDGSACGVACDPGFELRGGACAPLAPVPRFPPSTSTATQRRPRFRWAVPGGAVPVTVRLCRDRALTQGCLTVASSALDAAPASELAAGPWFWRVERSAAGQTATSATWEVFVGARSAAVGAAWGTVPDFNGDGLADILVGSSSSAPVPVHHGNARGIDPTPSYRLEEGVSRYGASVASAGDVNGDGFGDAIIGASRAFYVYFGGPAGLARSYSQRGSANGPFETQVASAGDVDGDGYGDVVAADFRTAAVLYYGGPGGLALDRPAVLSAPRGADEFGRSLAGLDMDADGFGDVAVGAPGANFAEGFIYLYRGSALGIGSVPVVLRGPPNQHLGFRIANAGDVNGDGYGDLVGSDFGGFGSVQVFQGSPTISTTAALTLARLPARVAGAGDVDGDGYGDVAVTGNGTLYLFLGSASGVSASPASTVPTSGTQGRSVAGAGDLNGDGFADVIVGGDDTARVYMGSASGLGVVLPGLLPLSGGSGFGESVARLGSRRRGAESTTLVLAGKR